MIDALPLFLPDENYLVNRSVRLRAAATAYFSRSYVGGTSPADTSPYIKTYSFWLKRGATATTQDLLNNYFGATNFWSIAFGTNETLNVYAQLSGVVSTNLISTRLFRDSSAWFHICISIDTTQATAANRIKVWINNEQITSWSTAVYPAQNTGSASFFTPLSGTWNAAIGRRGNATAYADGYLAEFNVIDGQALTPASFGEFDVTTGIWRAKKYLGTYGTNGFYLNFSDNSGATSTTIGKDSSVNGNDWTPNNISVTSGITYDSMLDVPTNWADGGNGRGNYAVLNPLQRFGMTLSNANLTSTSSGTTLGNVISTVGVTSGKWYWEVTCVSFTSVAAWMIGLAKEGYNTSSYVGANANGWGYYAINGNKYNNATSTAYGATYTTNDVIGVAFDADAGTLTFYKNGTSQGTAFTGLTSGPYFPAVSDAATTGAQVAAINFGQRPFAYTPPTGFVALNTQNLPAPTILEGNQYFDATAYTGNGSTQSIVNSGEMQPDLVWVKSRSGARNHRLVDSYRGATIELYSNLTNADTTDANGLTSFNADGFSVGSSTGYNGGSSETYVAWQWKEGATQGFDIVTYTGTGVARTISHNLGVTPSMIIVKRRDTTGNWPVRHVSVAAANTVYLNTAAASAAATTVWNSTAPTSSVFSVGTSTDVNANTGTYVAYLFSDVAGFSRFGSYVGNGNADGPFVFCGFRPRWILIKNITTGTTNWSISDTARSPDNVSDEYLLANTAGVEVTAAVTLDVLSNGFKIRNTGTWYNTSTETYIYAAFAENPFKYSLAR